MVLVGLSVNAKYRLILEREEQFAKALAYRVVDPPEMSPWLVIAPFYIIFVWYQNHRLRAGAETFSQEFLVTKKHALSAALDLAAGGGRDKRQALEAFRDTGENHPNQAAVRAVRLRQTAEMELLIDHYVRLLQADGTSYDDLVKDAYQTRSAYLDFTERLEQAEKAVICEAVRLTAKAEGDLFGSHRQDGEGR